MKSDLYWSHQSHVLKHMSMPGVNANLSRLATCDRVTKAYVIASNKWGCSNMFGSHIVICVSFILNFKKVTLTTLQGLEQFDGEKKVSCDLWREELDIFN